jgi:hypothetical protein
MVRTPRDAWCRSPLCKEVGKDLALDGVAGLEVELKSSKLYSPLGDVARGVRVVEDGPQWVRGHHHNLVGLEIVAELPGCNEYSIMELMRLGIPSLCLVQDLADVVDRLLDGPESVTRTGPFSLSGDSPAPRPSGSFPGRDPAGSPEAGSVVTLVVVGPPPPPGGTIGAPCRSCLDLSTTSTMVITSVVIARYRNNVLPGSGATRTGKELRYCFISWKACSASSVHVNGLDPLISLKKGRALSASLEMKWLRAARDPVNLCTSLIHAGGLIASIARILSRFASIPRCDTRKPRSFPAETPKTHFSGLSFVEDARSLLKT